MLMSLLVMVTMSCTQEAEKLDEGAVTTLVAPYPPGVVVKSNPAITIQGSIYLKVWMLL